jgi:hypothetical protein
MSLNDLDLFLFGDRVDRWSSFAFGWGCIDSLIQLYFWMRMRRFSIQLHFCMRIHRSSIQLCFEIRKTLIFHLASLSDEISSILDPAPLSDEIAGGAVIQPCSLGPRSTFGWERTDLRDSSAAGDGDCVGNLIQPRSRMKPWWPRVRLRRS